MVSVRCVTETAPNQMPRSCGISTRTGQRNDLLIPGPTSVPRRDYSEHRVNLLSRLLAVLLFVIHLSAATAAIVRAFSP